MTGSRGKVSATWADVSNFYFYLVSGGLGEALQKFKYWVGWVRPYYYYYRGVPNLVPPLELWNRFIVTRTPPKVYLFGLDPQPIYAITVWYWY